MRVLHTTLQRSPTVGVVNQMQWEQQAARSKGLPWEVIIYCPKDVASNSSVLLKNDKIALTFTKGLLRRVVNAFRLRNHYLGWLLEQQKYFDVIVLRYLSFEPHQLLFLWLCSKPVYFVHHTLELPELEVRSDRFKYLKIALEQCLGGLALKKSTGIVGVTHEIKRYELNRASKPGKPSYVYPNGIVIDQALICDKRGEIPELLFVAGAFYEWHGLDLLLNSIEQSQAQFTLHLVGQLTEDDKRRVKKDTRIRCYEHLALNEIKKIAESCWVGLASFSLHRKHMNEACTLKVREYLSMGLPVYSGHVDVFPLTFVYYHKGECDIATILSYAATQRIVSRQEVLNAAAPFIDKQQLLIDFYQYLLLRHTLDKGDKVVSSVKL